MVDLVNLVILLPNTIPQHPKDEPGSYFKKNLPPPTATSIRASTQEHLDIYDVQDDIVIMKDGACSLVIQVTAINFGLLSEGEQDAIIFAYAGLLNSLTFQTQIIIQSNIKDITDYIRLVKRQESKQKKDLLRNQLIKYREFVEATVRDNHVLDKKFYVAIPFTTYELGMATSVASTSFFFGSRKSLKPAYPIPHILERAKFNLLPKRDHLFRQFSRIGLKTRQLNTQQLLELFYNLYNRESVGQKFVDSNDYEKPFVQPAVGKTNTITPPSQFQSAPPPTPHKLPSQSPSPTQHPSQGQQPMTQASIQPRTPALTPQPQSQLSNNQPNPQHPTADQAFGYANN